MSNCPGCKITVNEVEVTNTSSTIEYITSTAIADAGVNYGDMLLFGSLAANGKCQGSPCAQTSPCSISLTFQFNADASFFAAHPNGSIQLLPPSATLTAPGTINGTFGTISVNCGQVVRPTIIVFIVLDTTLPPTGSNVILLGAIAGGVPVDFVRVRCHGCDGTIGE